MKKSNWLKWVFIPMLFLFFYGCKSDPVAPTPTPTEDYPKPISMGDIKIMDAQYIDTTTVLKNIDNFSNSSNNYLADLGNHIMNLPSLSKASVIWYCKVQYTSTDNKGQPITLSAKLIYPYRPFTNFTVPLLSFQHATELMKKYAPSKWGVTEDQGNFSEVVIAAGLALKNQWAIIMPDYQGMGDDVGEPHPLCVGDRLAKASADYISYMIAYLKSGNNNTNLIWNNQLFLMGFSEGGYSTLATVKEIETRGGITITGAACLDAPFDISGTMMNVILADTPFDAPYFLPYLLMGYNSVYESTKAFNFDSILVAPYATDLPKVADGLHTVAEVNAKMPQDKIVKKIFNQKTLAALKDTNSAVWKILHQNDMWYNWTPKSKILIAHCMNDDLVPYGNFQKIKAEWSGKAPNVQFFELGECINYLGTVHVSVAPWAFLQGSLWIASLVK